VIALILWACGAGSGPVETTAVGGPDLVVELGQSLRFDGHESTGETAFWDFGDASQAGGLVVEHTYNQPGNYTAVLQVTGADGSKKTDGVRVIAHRPLAETPPVWSSTLAVHRETGQIFVVNPEHDSVAVFSPQGKRVALLASCDSPRTVAIDESADRVLVACDKASAVDVFVASDLRYLSTVAFGVGERPFGVLARMGEWWVGLQGANAVVRFDASGALERVENIPDPRGLALAPDGDLLATRWRSIDGLGWVSRVDAGMGVGFEGVALALDTDPDSDTTSGGVPTLLDSLSISPDGGTLYIPGHQANIRRGLFQNGEALNFETAIRAVLRVVENGVENPLLAKLFDERGHANIAVPSPLGNLVFVLHPGSQSLSVLDAYSGAAAGSILNVGHTPSGLAFSPDGGTLYVNAWLDRELLAFDVRELSSTPPELFSVSTVEQEALAEDVLLGKRIFYSSADTRMARSGYLSCGQCHPDGREDGIVWDFTDRGEGLRNTTTLEGLGALHPGPLHWTGNFDELQDFENDIRGAFGGTGFLTEADWAGTSDALGEPKAGLSTDLDALAAFVLSLNQAPASPFNPPDGGELAFQNAGCLNCHPSPTYTDSSLFNPLRHDIGSLAEGSGQRRGAELDGLDTPSLLGIHATAPYLHDGSALNLLEAIQAHDSAAELSEAELGLIAAFVESL
jgi:DNA-binding beta-propeller fold protein YncE